MKRFHHFNLELKRLRKYRESDDQHLTSYLLTKYFPKYQKEFWMMNQNGATRSKIKRIKVINEFGAVKRLQNRSDWRILLANKMKSVKTLLSSSESPQEFTEKLKSFSGLKFVEISMSAFTKSPFGALNKPEFFLKKALKSLGRLRNLEHLEVGPISKESKGYFERLNSYQRLLDSLETLKFIFDWEGASHSEISELIDNNKNLLKNVTSLKLGTLHSAFHFESFQKLGAVCPKISNLSFAISCQEVIYQQNRPRRFGDECFEVKTNYLQTLRAFQGLRCLNVNIADVFTFLKDFTLPPSIQSLRLTFEECLSHEIMLKTDNSLIEPSEEELLKVFEENSLLLRFYKNFKGLQDLETLELFFAVDSRKEAYKYQSYLSQSLLKRIASPLKNLKILPTARGLNRPSPVEMRDSYLPQIIESCGNFAQTLRTLELGSPKVIYSNFDLSAYRNKFSNLTYLAIHADFSQTRDSDTETPGSLLKHFISLGESIVQINFFTWTNRNAESMLSLLKQIGQLEKSDQLKIRLELRLVHSKEMEESGINFADGINELKVNESCYPKMRRVLLNIFAGHPVPAEFEAFLELYQGKFEPYEREVFEEDILRYYFIKRILKRTL